MPPLPADDRPILRALVALGPTWEPIDDVRYIGNRSSGRMGLAIAHALLDSGCAVTAAIGPGVEIAAMEERADGEGGAGPAAGTWRVERFGSAQQLQTLLRREWPGHDLLIMAAAVADYRPVQVTAGKIRRGEGKVPLELVPTEDILASLAPLTRADQFVVGFALERPDELDASARAKLARKRVDAIVANPLETMDAPDVQASLLLADGTRRTPGSRLSKRDFARWLCAEVLPAARARAAREP